MSGPLSPRAFAVLAHRWSGLVIGLLWSVQGLTGALLVFAPQIERLGHPPASAIHRLSLDRLIASAQAAAGGLILRLTQPNRALPILDAAYVGDDGKSRFVRLDAESGKVVAVMASAPGVAAPATGWGWVRAVHERVLLGKGGAGLIAASGLFLLIGLPLGVWAGWPRPGQWRNSFNATRWRSPPQRRYGWHRAVGLVAAGPLMIIAGAGVYMALLALTQPSRPTPAPLASPPIGPQHAYEVAQGRFPGGAFSSLQLPTRARDVYGVRLVQPREVRQRAGRTLVEVDARSGQITKVYDPLDAPLAARLSDLVLPVHYGGVAGPIGQVLAAAAGLALPILYGLGVWAWWAKRRVRRRSLPASKT